MIALLKRRVFGNNIKILCSHRVIANHEDMNNLLLELDYFDVEEFEKRIKYILKHYKIITLEEAVTILKSKKSRGGYNGIVLTFDDGYASLYNSVFPILKKYKIPATIFLATDSIDNKTLLWYDKLVILIHETSVKTIQVPTLRTKPFDLGSTTSKALAISEIAELLKKEKPGRTDEILEEMRKLLCVRREAIKSDKLMLRWNQIREMHESGLVFFGSHTCSHPILTKIRVNELHTEIESSKMLIEEKLGVPILEFCYPNGDYNLQIKQIVEAAGYEYAVATDFKDITSAKDCREYDFFALKRDAFTWESFYRFALRLHGLFDLIDLIKGLSRRAHIWLPHYMARKFCRRTSAKKRPVHIFLAICDHFEPLWNCASYEQGLKRINKFLNGYKNIARRHKDSSGCIPRYSLFYPVEEYYENYLDVLTEFCREGYGEVEVHLHHDRDSSSQLREKLIHFKNTLRERHGYLSVDKETGENKYGFVHGNWALDNSREDGRFCGVNNELDLLKETGCYADFTMPSVPSQTQTSMVNSIYYAIDDPDNPKSHDRGEEVIAGSQRNQEDGLMMIQGPLEMNWHNRKGYILPTIENGALSEQNPMNAYRTHLWVKANVHVKGRSDCVFLKVYTHGCQEKNLNSLLSHDLDFLFRDMERRYNDGLDYSLHYVTAREMYNIVKWIEDHDVFEEINIEDAREYRIVHQN